MLGGRAASLGQQRIPHAPVHRRSSASGRVQAHSIHASGAGAPDQCGARRGASLLAWPAPRGRRSAAAREPSPGGAPSHLPPLPPPARRLINACVVEARRRGIGPNKLVPWVRRQLGGGILVLRFLSDGTAACSAPCRECAREIERFDLRVSCLQPGGEWFNGRLCEPGAPPAKMTTGQRREERHLLRARDRRGHRRRGRTS